MCQAGSGAVAMILAEGIPIVYLLAAAAQAGAHDVSAAAWQSVLEMERHTITPSPWLCKADVKWLRACR